MFNNRKQRSFAMKCKCGSIVTIKEGNYSVINGNFMVSCSNCNREYHESEFSEKEIERSYWKSDCLTESDEK